MQHRGYDGLFLSMTFPNLSLRLPPVLNCPAVLVALLLI